MTARLLSRKTAGITLATTLGAVPLGLGVLTTAQAAPPSGDDDMTTQSCSHSNSDKDKSGYGYVDADWLRYRVGPHPSCTSLGQAARRTKIYYHCFTFTDNDGTWTHGRIAGTNKQGWFKDSYLSDNGSMVKC
ncbi:hypothetical protein [Nocardioides sp. Soil796]|uniref:hypothetical protein n=1 Tax=Nocardioides sp. Soil796 TaxID=1736412 RepID=UPI00070A8DE7|nr:hypothetical protein [Nocardioides sp. Soil796]KRF16927.1 hypothetical protein ASH02_02385 [Nocardioides sp. Soil796]